MTLENKNLVTNYSSAKYSWLKSGGKISHLYKIYNQIDLSTLFSRNDIMINAMTYNALQNGKVFCFNPEVHRPILGIEDLCRAVAMIVEKGSHDNKGLYNLASFNSTAREISEAVAECTGADLEIVEELPETITNVKLQTKAYNFLIDSTKFKEVFDFDFKETPTTIVKSIVEQFDNMNKGNRSDAKLY